MLFATTFILRGIGEVSTDKKEIISILRQRNLLDNMDSGPTVAVISNGKKKVIIRVTMVGNHINISTGKILRRTMRIPISELE